MYDYVRLLADMEYNKCFHIMKCVFFNLNVLLYFSYLFLCVIVYHACYQSIIYKLIYKNKTLSLTKKSKKT